MEDVESLIEKLETEEEMYKNHEGLSLLLQSAMMCSSANYLQ